MPENPYCSSDRLFRSIIEQDGVFYRSQQRGEADFTFDQKHEILKELFTRNPPIFLQRYHSFISPCKCFLIFYHFGRLQLTKVFLYSPDYHFCNLRKFNCVDY